MSHNDILCLGSRVVVFAEFHLNSFLFFQFSSASVAEDIRLVPIPTQLDPNVVVGSIILRTEQYNDSAKYSSSPLIADRIGSVNISLCEGIWDENEIVNDGPRESQECNLLSFKALSVIDCNLETFRYPPSERKPANPILRKADWMLRGVASVGEKKGIRIPYSNLPIGAKLGTSWSFSMWAYFLSYETKNKNRLFFYRGTGDQSRTPSAWFDINSNKLLLRCSTSSEADIGAASISSIPIQEWVHLAFVFSNHSFLKLQEVGRPSFTYKMFLNGRLDSELTFASPLLVESNEGALIIGGKVDKFLGSPALLARLQLFDGELTLSIVQAEVDTFRFLFHRLQYTADASIPSSLIQDVHFLRGVVAATDLFSAWGEQVFVDSFPPSKVQSENERTHYLDTLIFRANKWLEFQSQFYSASEFEAWQITLDKYGIIYDPLVRQFSYSLDSSVHTHISADVISNDEAEAAISSFRSAVSSLNDCKADDFEVKYSEVNSAALIGVPGALSLLADFDQQPLRDQCPDELRRILRSHVNRRISSTANQNVFSSLSSVIGFIFKENRSQPILSSSYNFKTRNEVRARSRRVHAAMHGNAHALYMLGVEYMSVGTPFPEKLLPNSFDETFGFGLIHLAASLGEPYAWQLLSRKYASGECGVNSIPATVTRNHITSRHLEEIAGAQERLFNRLDESKVEDFDKVDHFFTKYSSGVPLDHELATYYTEWAADESSFNYHLPTGRPLHEMHRLSIDAADSGEVEKVQRGNDEPEIAFQKFKCEHQNDAGACNDMGYLYSWGANGLNRDLGEAFRYYHLGSELGDINSKVNAAQMLLKGEGVQRNVSSAIKHYNDVIQSCNQSSISVRALNGLGFAHFQGIEGPNGTELSQNHTLAFSYFQKSSYFGDGDGTFNLGLCYEFGFGTEKNFSSALETYQKGVNLGHFDCILALGRSFAHGSMTGIRNASRALPLLTAITNVGPWASLVRRGFDRYLAHDYEGAFLHYIHAYLLGFDIGAANAAYLLQRRLVYRHHQQQNLSFLLHQYSFSKKGDIDSALAIADFYVTGQGGAKKDVSAAIALYEQATLAGSPQAAFSLGLLFEEGVGVHESVKEAEQYYNKALLLSNSSFSAQQVARLALARLSIQQWITSQLRPYLDITKFFQRTSKSTEMRNIWKPPTYFSTRWLEIETSVFRNFLSSTNGPHESQRPNDGTYFLSTFLISFLVLIIVSRIFR
jgi:TPR repeat protein